MDIGNIINDPNIVLSNKLLEASFIKQEGNAQNMANWPIEGAKKVVLSKDFETQLASLIENGNYEAINNLVPTLEEKNDKIDFEDTLSQTKSTYVYSTSINEILRGRLAEIKKAITGKIS